MADSTGKPLPTGSEDVDIKTPDGICDGVIAYPKGDGPWPAVLMWTDVLGLTPTFREMASRLAAQGYVVLVPNPYYRARRAPVVAEGGNLMDADVRAVVFPLAGQLNDEGMQTDAAALVAYLDSRPQTDKSKKIGTNGYCMGGRFAFVAGAAAAERIGAVASIHGFLVNSEPTSPHLSVARSKARYLVAIAQNDDAAMPNAKDVLRETFAETGRDADVSVYPANHGWCVKSASTYDEPSAERAWAALIDFYGAALA